MGPILQKRRTKHKETSVTLGFRERSHSGVSVCFHFPNSVMWEIDDQELSPLTIQCAHISCCSPPFFRREGTIGDPRPQEAELLTGFQGGSFLL